jgi:hypothetical protein
MGERPRFEFELVVKLFLSSHRLVVGKKVSDRKY